MECLLERHGQITWIFDQEIVFDDGACDADRIAFLESIQTDGCRGHLTRDDHHRDAVHVGGSDAGHGIREPRPDVTNATPTSPVARAYPSAACTAACSWRTSTC